MYNIMLTRKGVSHDVVTTAEVPPKAPPVMFSAVVFMQY